jgi:transcription elongation factor
MKYGPSSLGLEWLHRSSLSGRGTPTWRVSSKMAMEPPTACRRSGRPTDWNGASRWDGRKKTSVSAGRRPAERLPVGQT